MTKIITKNELTEHTDETDCWLLINNRVYDISSYLKDHPGGATILLEHSAIDSTEFFHEIGHSDTAKEKLKEFYIGDIELAISSTTSNTKSNTSYTTSYRNTDSTKSNLKVSMSIFEIGALVILIFVLLVSWFRSYLN